MPEPAAKRWAATILAAVGVGVAAFLAVSRLAGDEPPRRASLDSASVSPAPLATFYLRAPHVLSQTTAYSLQGVVGGPSAVPPEELPPAPVSAFKRPVALYRGYAVAQLGLMEDQIARLEGALAANDRASAKAAWRAADVRYLHLGAVYLVGQVAILNREIDGTASGLVGGVANDRFAGLHRIEYGLWTGRPLPALRVWARRLDVAVRRLRRVLPGVSITPLEYATRAHEILEDAARDQLSGADVPWSGEGVIATRAGLEATEEVLSTLAPVLNKRELIIPAIDTELAALRGAMSSIAAAHGGHLPADGQLTQRQSELLDASLGGALEALSQVPGSLETEAPPRIPQLTGREVRIDP